MSRICVWILLWAFSTGAAPAPSSLPRAGGDATAARLLWLHGRYDEARRAYESLATQQPVVAAIGIARCHRALGRPDDATGVLLAAARAEPKSAAVQAELAGLEFERGQVAVARGHVDAALALDPDQPAARFLAAELDRVAGRIEQANEGYRWFIGYYNREQDRIADPEVLRWIGLAGAQYARWNRNSGQFHFLINTFYPDLLKLDADYWPAHIDAALLFIEKYNRPDAMTELAAGLGINPNSAELHAARALVAFQQFDLDSARAAITRALALNPRLLVAHWIRADLLMVASTPRDARAALEVALALDPSNEETLGRLAAVEGCIAGLDQAPARAPMQALIEPVVRRNPHCGAFFAALASSLDLLHRYPYAARYYEEARKRMPQLISVPGQLGLVTMRLGDETRAREMLAESFEIDPFNVRVRNSLEVLGLLERYGTLETEHFVLRFDRSRDSLLARYASRYLEREVYPEVVAAFGYAPPGKSLIEIFARAGSTSGHSWFSARMAGLPFIGTVGGCAGRLVGLTSPGERGMQFNWARVLRHEFVHVVNLQQTDFSIPRWYTEGLAVEEEGPGHPPAWEAALARRAAANHLFNLDTINMGFVRPSSGEDWALAYYQAYLYVRYLADTYGREAPGRMVAAYAGHLDTPGALKRCFGVTQEAFERGYRAYVGRTAGAPDTVSARPAPSDAEAYALERAADEKPRDAGLLARAGAAALEVGRPYRGRELAQRALAIDPRQQQAAYVIARVCLIEGNKAGAREALRTAFDAQAARPDALALEASLALDAGDYAEAERLGLLGLQRFPRAADWQQGLAVVYRATGQTGKLLPVLTGIAERDANDLASRTELARLASGRRDFAAAARWAREALWINVNDPETHAILARAEAEGGRNEPAIEEFSVAISLEPDSLEWRLGLAHAHLAARDPGRARAALAELLGRDPQHAGAKALLDSLGGR